MYDRPTCGTYAGYIEHRRRGEDADPACRRANTDYSQQRRAQDPEQVEQHRAYNRAYQRALRRLRDENERQFRQLLRRELAAVGGAGGGAGE